MNTKTNNSATEFTPLPKKSFRYRGVEFTRSTCIRAIKSGVLKSRLLRQPGSTKGRRYILTESLDSYLADCMVDVPVENVIFKKEHKV